MEMLCPECLGVLETADGQTARCTLHGGKYRILFSRSQVATAARAPAAAQAVETPGISPGMCPQHPSVQAEHACARCSTTVCATCAFPQADGTQLCPECASQKSPGPPAAAVPAGTMCAQHPSVQAARLCTACGSPMCETCDFTFPGNVHVCPRCVAQPKGELSAKRKRSVRWSLALAVWCTLGLAVLLCGALAEVADTQEELAVLGVVISLLVLTPSIIGTAVGVSALDRRLSNPASIWVAVIWNSLILGLLLILTIIGTVS